jgi:farnesyl diphosphate synthase
MHQVAELLQSTMNDILPHSSEEVMESKLFDAMRYTTLSPGKRLRPFLTITTADVFGVSLESSMRTAAAIEFIHSYSLIHDDLPAMDNDDYRRGQPSCHKKFSEATAILTGDALLTLAFEVLSDEATHSSPIVRLELINKIARAAGYKGMVGGQMIDMLTADRKLSFNEIVRLQHMKTGAMFSISCEVGAILGRAPDNLRNSLRAYANNIGLAFQITDDLLDAEGTREATGKTVGKDQQAGKATLISCIGIPKAKEHARMLASQAKQYLIHFDARADLLRDLADYIVGRSK